MSPASFEETRQVRREGVEIHVKQWGDGTPLLLIHGLGMSTDLWKHQLPVLGRTHRLIALDLRGFGRSSKPTAPGAYAIAEMARDVAAVAAELGIARAHVLGTSMGGFVAQELALVHRDLCRSVVLAHTSARMTMPADVLASRLALLRSAPIASYAELVADQALAAPVDPAVRAWLVAMLARNDARAYERVLVEGLGGFDRSADTEAIAPPALVIVGELDRVIPPDGGRELAKRIRGAELVEIAGVGHISYAERPMSFNGAVAHFLRRVEAADA